MPEPFGATEDHIDIGRGHDARALLVGDAEAVGEIERLARCEVLFDGGPYGDLPGVGEQILDDRGALGGLFDFEERFARHPAVGDGLVPAFRALALADDDVESVVAQVQRLAGALHAVADDGDGFVFEDFEGFLQGEFLAGYDVLFDVAEIDLCHDVCDFSKVIK